MYGNQEEQDRGLNHQETVIMNQLEEPGSRKGSGMAITSLVCGIVSIVLCCAYGFALVSGIVGLVFGIISLVQKRPEQGMAIVGVITSALGILLGIAILVINLASLFYT